jgi:hypothetical protein
MSLINGIIGGLTPNGLINDLVFNNAPFTPANRGSNLKLWLQGSGILHSGGTVTSWPDSSGNWPAAVPNSVAPAYTASSAALNNQPATTWVSASLQNLLLSTFTISQPDTIYVVCNIGLAGNLFDGNVARQIIGVSAPDWYMYAGSALVSSTSSGAATVLCGVFSGGSSALYANNSATSIISGSASTANLTGLLIGSGNGGAAEVTGDIAEIIIISGADTAPQRAQMYAYFAAKYKLAVS